MRDSLPPYSHASNITDITSGKFAGRALVSLIRGPIRKFDMPTFQSWRAPEPPSFSPEVVDVAVASGPPQYGNPRTLPN